MCAVVQKACKQNNPCYCYVTTTYIIKHLNFNDIIDVYFVCYTFFTALLDLLMNNKIYATALIY